MVGGVLLVVGCTREVPLSLSLLVPQQDKNPSKDRHFRASRARVGPQDQIATATAGLAQRQVAPFAIAHGESDSLLGSCSLMRPDFANRVVEVGYWVAPWARGGGVAVKALTVLCDWAGEIGFERVEAVVLAGNDASAVVAERAGLGFEALLKSRVLLDGQRHDVRLHARVLTEAGGLAGVRSGA